MSQRLLKWSMALLVVFVGSLTFISFASTAVTADANVFVDSVNVSEETPVAGEPFVITATIANSASSSNAADITEVGIRRDGTLEFHDDLGTLGPGDTTAVPISQTIEEPGQHKLRVIVHANDGNGSLIYIQYPVYVEVREESNPIALSISSESAMAGEETAVNVTVANGGNAPVSDVELTLSGDGKIANPRRVSASLAAGSNREYAFRVTYPEEGTAALRASVTYTRENGAVRNRSTSVSKQVDPADSNTEGRIQLTGVETTSVGSRITIQGDAANVGTTDAQSVLLSVQRTDGVSPVQPSGEYFIGTVEGSEFGSFELTSNVDESVSAVPVLVEWTVDDERRSEVVQLNIGDSEQQASANTPSSGQGPDGRSAGLLGNIGVGTLILVLVVIGIASIAYFAWTRQ